MHNKYNTLRTMGSPITIHSFEVIGVINGTKIVSINGGFAYIALAATSYPPMSLCFLKYAENNKYYLVAYKHGVEYIRQEAVRSLPFLTAILERET
jgi:NADH:ubiquinone oxidoreductase subunit H